MSVNLKTTKCVKRKKQKGIALLLALSLLLIVSSFALGFFKMVDQVIAQESTLKNMKSKQQVMESMYSWAQQVLLEDYKKNAVDHLGEAWAQSIPEIGLGAFAKSFRNNVTEESLFLENEEQYSEWFVSGYVVDVERHLNLGSLIFDAPTEVVLRQEALLLELCKLKGVDYLEVMQALGRARKFMQEGLLPKTMYGLISVEPKVFERLGLENIILLPSIFGKLNINTASEAMVHAHLKKIAPNSIQTLIEERNKGYFKNINDLNQRMFTTGSGWNNAYSLGLTTESSAFLVTVSLRDGSRRVERKKLFIRALLEGREQKESEYKWIRLE